MKLFELIQQVLSEDITNLQIVSGIFTVIAALAGAWIGSYVSKRSEFKAVRDDFAASLKMLEKQTEVVEETKKKVESLRFDKTLKMLQEQTKVVEETKKQVERLRFDESLIMLEKQTKVIEETKKEVESLRADEKLALDLQRARGIERQELRYKSYAELWSKLRPLAVYDESEINNKEMGELSGELSNWYFSENGGLLLTPQAREFYFALQDLLRTTSNPGSEWKVDRSEAYVGGQKKIFKDVLTQFADDRDDKCEELLDRLREEPLDKPSQVFQYFVDKDFKEWQKTAPDKGIVWRNGIKCVAKNWDNLNNTQRFATLQQVGSILRTSLTNDLESRFH